MGARDRRRGYLELLRRRGAPHPRRTYGLDAPARIILEHGESRSFDPFDRLAQFKEDKTQPLDRLLDRFQELRTQSLDALRGLHLTPKDFSRTGIHPAIGRVTLGQLLSTWTVHDLTHISQISRVLAKQYEAEVGPWKGGIGILNIKIDRSGDDLQAKP